MAQQTIENSSELSTRIEQRRIELGLTIEEAASKAGVDTKIWRKYENGGSIRKDKSKVVCKALGWRTLPTKEDHLFRFDVEEYRQNASYPLDFEKIWDPLAPVSFVIGSKHILYHFG